jgi:hypothetical protein
LGCPNCDRVVLVCDEIGNVFDDLSNLLASSPLVIWRSAAQRCPGCNALPLASFIPADERQLLASGVGPEDFTPAPYGMPFSIRNLSSA